MKINIFLNSDSDLIENKNLIEFIECGGHDWTKLELNTNDEWI